MKSREKYKLTPTAISQLKEIANHTELEWGVAQRNKYMRELYDCFQLLAQNPYIGKDRSEIKPRYRSIALGSHVVFYIVADLHIEIIGIPHAREDMDSVFGKDAERTGDDQESG